MTDLQRSEILELWMNGWRMTEIAEQFDITAVDVEIILESLEPKVD
jgi:uncharacterized protein (DUF433 family)